MVRTRLNIGCRYSTPVLERPLHPTRSQFKPQPSQTQAPVTPATEPERRAGGGLTTLHSERWILAPLRNHVFHDLASLNRAIAAQVRKINSRPYTDGTGETRYGRFESVDLPHIECLAPAAQAAPCHGRSGSQPA